MRLKLKSLVLVGLFSVLFISGWVFVARSLPTEEEVVSRAVKCIV